jgi:hypothetical protein
MSTQMRITATEHGIVRLFAVETAQASDHAALCDALGVETLDPAHVDMITLSDLDELGLEGYLALGMGIEPSEIDAMRPQINTLKGDVVFIRSAAFGAKAVNLTPTSPLRWIATFGEAPINTMSTPMKTNSAQGTLSGATPADRPSNNKVLFWVLAAFALIVAITISMFIRITP